MIRTLIVEDEVLARLGLHQLVDWERLGFTLLEDAKDGSEALERMERDRPQLVLLDLNLPKLNGLQLQKVIASTLPDCYVVVISCNEEFSVVKDVMRHGAFDFLRKLNLTKEELTRVLSRCRMEIEKSAVRGEDGGEERALRYEAMVSPNSDWLTEGDAPEGMVCVAMGDQSEKAVSAVARRFQEALRREGIACRVFLRDAKCFYLLPSRLPAGFDWSALGQRVARQVGKTLYLGITPMPIQSHRSLILAASLCEQILLCAYYETNQTCQIYREPVQRPAGDAFDPREDHDRFRAALHTMDLEELRWAVHTLFDRIQTHGRLSVNALHRVFMDVLSLYSTVAQKLGHSLEEVEVNGSFAHYQAVIALNLLSEVRAWFLLFSQQYVDCFYIPCKASRSDILRRTLDYVEAHLSSAIQLCSVASAINVSETYLSSMFKKEIGRNFISYVHQRKIEAAKRMLEAGQLVKEVSDQLGYENCSYFSKVFKKEVGVAPDAWRKQAL